MFTNYHIAISREVHAKTSYNIDPSIEVVERIETPKLNPFLALLKRVGGRYGWDRRPKYLDFPAISSRLSSPESRFFDILKDGQPVGYMWVNKPDNSLSWHYAEAAQGRKTIEIENLGLFDKHTGKGIGDSALPLILGILLKDNDNVYLTTRSTNHKKVVPFYTDNGMTVIHQEVLPDDLVPENDPRLLQKPKVA